MNYPTFEQLGEPPIPFDLGGAILHALGRRRAPAVLDKTPSPVKSFVSRYRGVTRTQGKYCAQWLNERGTYSRGPRRPDTPEGEWQAACDWAQVMGKAEPEVRG